MARMGGVPGTECVRVLDTVSDTTIVCFKHSHEGYFIRLLETTVDGRGGAGGRFWHWKQAGEAGF